MENTAQHSLLEEMLRSLHSCTKTVGGLDFYGQSREFNDLFQICEDTLALDEKGDAGDRHAHIFLEEHHGKTSIAKALEIEGKAKGIRSFYLDGTIGLTQKTLQEFKGASDVLVIVDGLPEAAPPRTVVLERFRNLGGKAILFASPNFRYDVSLGPTVRSVQLSHVDERPLDKIAWLLGLIRESLASHNDLGTENPADAIALLPVSSLLSLSRISLGVRVKDLTVLAEKFSDLIRLRSDLRPMERLSPEDVMELFLEFYAPPQVRSSSGFRVWVEGDTDTRLFKLVSKLGRAKFNVDLEESLSVVSLGAGRDGGTSKVLSIIVERGTRKNSDLFVFDCDDPGRQAKDKAATLDQDALLLEPKLSCSRCDQEVEIEDFISLSCLDRFYSQNATFRPEKELIKYKEPIGRRLVVEGVHKEALIEWLEANASFEELENIFFMLCEIRSRFALRIPLSHTEMGTWKRRLQDNFDIGKHFGNRPGHWWDEDRTAS
jgi:hypothetical protein